MAFATQKTRSTANRLHLRLTDVRIRLKFEGRQDFPKGTCVLAHSAGSDYDTLTRLGAGFFAQAAWDQAEIVFAQAQRLAPDRMEAHLFLPAVMIVTGRKEEGKRAFRQTLERFPEGHNKAVAVALAARDIGYPELGAAYLRFLEAHPEYFGEDCYVPVDLAYDDPESDVAAGQRLRHAWAARHAPAPDPTPFHNDPDPNRRLRVGYVAATFCINSSRHLVRPPLVERDRGSFEATLYSMTEEDDAETRRFRDLADGFVDVRALDDSAFIRRVREDRIDILVDIASHSPGNRLLAMARRAAPIQVSAWGNPTGSGLAAIDYLFADPIFIRPDERGHFAEMIWDLPHWACCEEPEQRPKTLDPPLLAKGYPTFGFFGRFRKISEAARDAWAKLMLAVPDARLVIKSLDMGSPDRRRLLLQAFAARGIAPERINLVMGTDRHGHLHLHREIDIVLDSLPHASGITAFEALWMSTPVVTLAGNAPHGRGAAALLHHLDLEGLVAENVETYIATAAVLARQRDTLVDLHRTLRARLASRPAGNPRLYARAVETAYREMWRGWCAGR